MDKYDKSIMVVQRRILFGDDYFEGFRRGNEVDYETRILGNYVFIRRGIAEHDFSYKQPIGYVAIVNPILKRVFAYQRAIDDKKYSEKRLQGKYSWGVGGHIEKFDVEVENPIHASILREINEEIEINNSINLKLSGFINHDADDVGRVHFGLLYIVETDSRVVGIKDSEIASGGWKTIEELEKICASPDYVVEEWSKISLGPLKEYLCKKVS